MKEVIVQAGKIARNQRDVASSETEPMLNLAHSINGGYDYKRTEENKAILEKDPVYQMLSRAFSELPNAYVKYGVDDRKSFAETNIEGKMSRIARRIMKEDEYTKLLGFVERKESYVDHIFRGSKREVHYSQIPQEV